LLERRAAQLDKAAAAEQRTAEALAALTIDRFVEGDHLLEGLDPALSADRRTELARQMVLGSVATDRLVRERAHHTSRLASLRSERDALRERAERLRSDVTRLESSTAELTASLEQLGPRIVEAQQRRDQARMSASIDGTDMSTIALDAYWRAEQHLSLIDPDCGVTWWVLAGIGRTESLHGTYRGARVAVDGMVSPPIYGPDLDGSNDFAVVRDSDGGRLDGTARTDRAVGPMQFLPGTWRAVSIDLDLDGVADPQNLFDAAASAGAYLCRSGPRLTEREALRAALLTYNRSWAYVDLVEERGREYATAVPLP
jgi:membrane-bound lytic murein transglycosylase B